MRSTEVLSASLRVSEFLRHRGAAVTHDEHPWTDPPDGFDYPPLISGAFDCGRVFRLRGDRVGIGGDDGGSNYGAALAAMGQDGRLLRASAGPTGSTCIRTGVRNSWLRSALTGRRIGAANPSTDERAQ